MQVMKPEPQAGGPAREGQAGKKPVLAMICLWCEARWAPHPQRTRLRWARPGGWLRRRAETRFPAGKSSLEPQGSHGVFSLSRHLCGLGLLVRKMISLDEVTGKSLPLRGLCTKDGLLFLAFSLIAF